VDISFIQKCSSLPVTARARGRLRCRVTKKGEGQREARNEVDKCQRKKEG